MALRKLFCFMALLKNCPFQFTQMSSDTLVCHWLFVLQDNRIKQFIVINNDSRIRQFIAINNDSRIKQFIAINNDSRSNKQRPSIRSRILMNIYSELSYEEFYFIYCAVLHLNCNTCNKITLKKVLRNFQVCCNFGKLWRRN